MSADSSQRKRKRNKKPEDRSFVVTKRSDADLVGDDDDVKVTDEDLEFFEHNRAYSGEFVMYAVFLRFTCLICTIFLYLMWFVSLFVVVFCCAVQFHFKRDQDFWIRSTLII